MPHNNSWFWVFQFEALANMSLPCDYSLETLTVNVSIVLTWLLTGLVRNMVYMHIIINLLQQEMHICCVLLELSWAPNNSEKEQVDSNVPKRRKKSHTIQYTWDTAVVTSTYYILLASAFQRKFSTKFFWHKFQHIEMSKKKENRGIIEWKIEELTCTIAICKMRTRRPTAIEATAITSGPVRNRRTIPNIAFDFPHAISLVWRAMNKPVIQKFMWIICIKLCMFFSKKKLRRFRIPTARNTVSLLMLFL